MYRAKNDNSEPRIHLTGNSEFSESSKLSPWPFLNCFRHLEFSQLTMNNRTLILYFRSLLYAIVLNMTHFFILFGMRESNGLFSTVSPVSPVLMQNLDIWNFHSSPAWNNGKLV